MLSKPQAHVALNLLQMLMSSIETGNIKLLKEYVRKLTDFINAHTDPA